MRITLTCAAILIGLAAVGQSLKFISEDGMKKIGSYKPLPIGLTKTRPAGLQGGPSGEGVLYGVIKFGSRTAPKSHAVILVDKDDGAAVAYVDMNADGSISETEKVEWTPNKRPAKTKAGETYEMTVYQGKVGLKSSARSFGIGFYHFSRNYAKEAGLNPDSIYYYRDYAVAGKVRLGSKSYEVILSDDGVYGDFGKAEAIPTNATMLFDFNENGKFGERGESFKIGEPFAHAGTTYEVDTVSADGTTLTFKRSAKVVDEVALPPSLGPGKSALKFSMVDTAGKPVNFPTDFKGKVVLLDFWATWCGPCVKEVPNVVATYEKFHSQGFEIIGISLDREGDLQKLTDFTAKNKMPWQQVFDGKFWNAEIAKLYDVHSIPQMYLIDGTTGKILAEGSAIRGEGLPAAVEKALSGK